MALPFVIPNNNDNIHQMTEKRSCDVICATKRIFVRSFVNPKNIRLLGFDIRFTTRMKFYYNYLPSFHFATWPTTSGDDGIPQPPALLPQVSLANPVSLSPSKRSSFVCFFFFFLLSTQPAHQKRRRQQNIQ